MPDEDEKKLIHEVLPVGWLQCNCSILGDPETREALVLDPGDEVERVLAVLKRHSLHVRAIVSTHAHIDHVGGLQKLQEVTGAPVLMHGDDLELYQHLDEQAAWLGVPPPPSARIDQLLREGDTVSWGKYKAGVLHTPGHTPGSVSLYLPPGVTESIALCRRHALCRQHRTHGPVGRLDAGYPAVNTEQAAGAAGARRWCIRATAR